MHKDIDAPCDCRVCECLPAGSWFKDWMVLWPTSEPPHSYILLSVMALLGGILGRKVYMPYDFRNIYPMLNVLLIGPSGIGKSTSVSMAREALPFIPEERRPQFISGSATKEKLHEDLVRNPHAIVFASELATLFSKEKYKEGLIPYVTQLLDYEPIVESRNKKDNVTYVENPEVTFIGASTREWITNMLPDSASQGGFLPRFLPVLEEQRGQRLANPQLVLPADIYKRLLEKRERVKEQFTALGLAEGEISYEDDAAVDRINFWYNGLSTPTGALAPFFARALEMVLRISVLFAVSARRYVITEDDVLGAIRLYRYLASRFADITVATTPAGKLLQAVREAITFDGTQDVDLFRSLSHLATVQEIIKQTNSLVISGQITKDGNRFFRNK